MLTCLNSQSLAVERPLISSRVGVVCGESPEEFCENRAGFAALRLRYNSSGLTVLSPRAPVFSNTFVKLSFPAGANPKDRRRVGQHQSRTSDGTPIEGSGFPLLFEVSAPKSSSVGCTKELVDVVLLRGEDSFDTQL